MRLRLLPWMRERLKLPLPDTWSSGGETNVRELSILANSLRIDTLLATSVKYFCPLLGPWVGADSSCLKVRDGAPLVEYVLLSSIPQMPGIPPKSTHARDRMGGRLYYGPARESSEL